ncbi:fungal-specific transcription factor domain-containing protein [Lentinula aciculospora]|uniref:Fungal-specific transcription factor domain-containing protein n=1 Tax=Lentinula aciculospora TaxID=153920 RepID=A0A9W9A5H1_9AGAR|nr:fungal-specific transcription factor domain-containing protein [Lentinula aciculospora]
MSIKNELKDNLRSFPQMSPQEKTNIRRVQGQISCAECRRLVNDSLCLKQSSSEFVIQIKTQMRQEDTVQFASYFRVMTSDTAALQKIQAMKQRISQLENALTTLHATVSSEPHPMLTGTTLGTSRTEPREKSLPHDERNAEIVDALGTLTLGKLGDARYLGRSAGSESLLEGSPEVESTVDEDDFIPTNEIAQLVNSFPFAPDNTWDVESSTQLILSYLPEQERAWALAEGFLTHNFWYITIVSKEELIEELITPVYRFLSALDARPADPANTFPLSPTRLAVLFICLAHGSLADLSIPMYSAESALFFNLSRASLALHPIFVSPDLATVQALTLIGSYYDTGGPNYSIEAGWIYMTIAAKLTHSLGLHRESPKWGLDDKTIQRRRAIFWELYTFDGLTSLALGRPPSLFKAHGDTPLPFDNDDSVNDQGIHRWRMTFSRDVITAVANVTLSSGMPDYQTILDLDQLVREHPLPQKYDPVRSLSSSLEDSTIAMDDEGEHVGYEGSLNALKGHHLTQFRAVVVMHVHRAFFAQVLLQSPSDPLSSVYAPSFLAAYRTASTMVHLNVKHFYKYPNILSRYWEIWTGLLSAGVILGLIVTRAPTNPLVANAYAELGLALDLFKMGAPRSDRAKRGLNVLLRMYEKATNSYLSTNSQKDKAKGNMNVISEDADALHTLETFAGYTKLLMKEMRSSRSQISDSGPLEASGQYQSGPSPSKSESQDSLPADIYMDISQPSQGSDYSFSSPSSTYSSSSSPIAVLSSDRIPLLQSPVDRPPFLGYDYTDSTSPFAMPPESMYSFEKSDTSFLSGYGMRTLREIRPASSRYSSSPGFATQREYWSDNPSQHMPKGSYVERSWTSAHTQGSGPSYHPGRMFEEISSWNYNKEGVFSRPASQTPFTVGAMDAQWAELMRDEGVWNME